MKVVMDNEYEKLMQLQKENDRLAGQVEELKDFVKQLTNAKVYSVEVLSRYGGENSMDCLCDSWKEKANQLLTSMGENDE